MCYQLLQAPSNHNNTQQLYIIKNAKTARLAEVQEEKISEITKNTIPSGVLLIF